ncbi:MAG: creatininase family protein [Planctomycetes bacterium]|nr:creatininase family protein [Planctomycetota bacterium]
MPTLRRTASGDLPARCWRWEELSEPAFRRARRDAKDLCLVPLGILERHGPHLPLGTDMLCAHALALRAAAREPAVVLPPHILGQIHEHKHWPGAIAIRTELALEVLENLCDEIARNGFRRIVLLNAHGGNDSLLNLFGWKKLEKPRPYQLFILRLADYYGTRPGDRMHGRLPPGSEGHGGIDEASLMMSLRPDLVDLASLRGRPHSGRARRRLAHLPAYSPFWWYADYPDAYSGDARAASAAIGESLVEGCAGRIATAVKAIKRDRAAARLEAEFFARIQH